MIPFARIVKYGNIAPNIQLQPLVDIPCKTDLLNHGDSTNPLYASLGYSSNGTLTSFQGRGAIRCNGGNTGMYYDEGVMKDTSWSAMQWVYTSSTNAKAYINASANVGFSYNTGGSPSLTRNFYCVNSGTSSTSFFGDKTMPVNEWVHVCYVYDVDARTLKFYYNGVLVKTITGMAKFVYATSGSIGDVARRVGLGFYPSNAGTTALIGGIAQHKLYLGALKDGDILSIYTSEIMDYNNSNMIISTIQNTIKDYCTYSAGASINLNPSTFTTSSNNAIEFNNGYVQLSTQSIPTSYVIGNSTNFTIETNLYLRDTSVQMLIGNLSNSAGSGSYWITLNNTFQQACMVSIDGFNASTVNRYRFGAGLNIPINQWCTLKIERIGTVLSVYLNGTLVGSSQTMSVGFTNQTNPMRIGLTSDGAYPLNGIIDNFRIQVGN